MVPAKKDPREDFGSAQSTRCVRGDALPRGPRKHGSLCAEVAEAGPGHSWSTGEMGGETSRTAWPWDACSLRDPSASEP